MTKAVMKLRMQGMFLNIIKAIYDKLIVNIVLNGEQQNHSPKVKNERRISTFSVLTQCSFGIPSKSNMTSTRNKRDSNVEGRIQSTPICR
jgi:hypothetical protein